MRFKDGHLIGDEQVRDRRDADREVAELPAEEEEEVAV
jgi:hypothetical protein